MIIDRFVFQVKKGCNDAAVAVIKEEIAIAEKGGGFTARLLATVFGTFDELVMEAEFEDMGQREAFWAKWAAERNPIFAARFDPLNTGIGTNELWNVVEPVSHDPKCKLVNRREFLVVPGGMDAVAGIITSKREGLACNVHLSNLGFMNRVVMELELESLNAHDEIWAAWGEKHDTPEFWAKWDSLTLPGGVNEIWQVL